MIVGLTDTTGDAEQNLQLSCVRASAVRNWMQRMGDIPETFAVQGTAGSQPIADNCSAPGRAANRRVDIQRSLWVALYQLIDVGENPA